MTKKRILWVSEASFMATGFSTLTMEILQRLHNTGKYEIAELGCYAKTSDQRASYLPWTFYGGIPEREDVLGNERYNNSMYGQFGESVFEQVCLDFKPDIVVDVRDWWMCEYQLRSPYRRFFKLMWMPTVDGEPQRLEWLDSYSRADMILTYSKYGKEVLEREAPEKVKVFDIVGPGVDHELFKPMDKKELRSYLSVPQDANIIMTVMRNQRRKLYPDLIETFAEYLKHCAAKGDEKLANNTYLYIHTSYPDVGFDISRHIMQNGVGHRVLTTYVCQNCKTYYVDFFQTELTTCNKCGALAAHMPNTQNGVTRQQLAKLINLADLYVQYSICEGFGMPLAEGKACGVPAMGIDYSATSEQVNAPGCKPINVAKFFYEPIIETEQKRALPDTKDAVKKFYNFFKLSQEERTKLGLLAREDAVKNHSFERAATVFARAIDSMEIHDSEKTWDNPEQFNAPMDVNVPNLNNNGVFIDWCLVNILGRPDLRNSYWRNELVKGLNVGFMIQRGGREGFNHESAVNLMMQMAKNNNFWERIRTKPFAKKQALTWEMV